MSVLTIEGETLALTVPADHPVSRTKGPGIYPRRFPVPTDMVPWSIPFPMYDRECAEFTAPVVLQNFPHGWAHPLSIADVPRSEIRSYYRFQLDALGYPLNVVGRTGLRGRGLLGKWGANFAADPIVTWLHPDDQALYMLSIVREDCGQFAIPGGMADKGELVGSTLTRELGEETGVHGLSPDRAKLVYAGYVDDPRNTDNAWMETVVGHWHVEFEVATSWAPKAGSDAKKVQPLKLAPDVFPTLYASHGQLVRLALTRLMGKSASLDAAIARAVGA